MINIINLLINLLYDRDIHETKFVDFINFSANVLDRCVS